MQIAKIVPKIRTQNEGVFDYAIPPELLPQIKIGILVKIPFHNRMIEGIIIGLKRSSIIPNIKPIDSIIDLNPVIDTVHTELARWMSDYYISPLSKTLFENIVPPAKRYLKNNSTIFRQKGNKLNKISHNFLIIGSFNYRLKFYLQAIKKTLIKNQQIIILVPDLTNVPYFTKYFKNYSLIHSGLTKTQRFVEWDKIRRGLSQIIIGSNSALFAPTDNLGLVIVDQEENETYKNSQSPRYHAPKVAQKLCHLSCANLILGSLTPSIETYQNALQSKFRIFTSKQKNKNIALVNMNFEKSILSFSLQNAMSKAISEKKKTLLVLNRKGEGTKLTCLDCHWIYTCPKCGLPVAPQNNFTTCFNCEKNYPILNICPKCSSSNLKATGMGTIKLEKIVKKLFPDVKITRLENSQIQKTNQEILSDWDIAIVTSYALKFNLPPIELVGIIDADSGFNFPDFRSAEKTFQTLYKFLRLAPYGIIQTHLDNNTTLAALSRLDYQEFLNTELNKREQQNYPPFGKLIRLVYQNEDVKTAINESTKISQNLLHLREPIDILGPSPSFTVKRRAKYRYHVILKTKNNWSDQVKSFLKNLSKDWIVDVDPWDLL